MQIGSTTISREGAPVIISELSGNHNGRLETAFELIDAIARSGSTVVKFQTYTPDGITLNCARGNFAIEDATSLWHGMTLYDLYTAAHTPREWHADLIARAKENGLDWFSAVFDIDSVPFLFDHDISVFKIASQEIVHIPLIREVALTGRPVIFSTGMASIREIAEAIEEFRKFSSADFALMKCTSKYPANPSDSNLKTIPVLREMFSCEVGFSDHTVGFGAPVAAVTLGASFVEKHITLSRAGGGVDNKFSSEPSELRILVEETRAAWESLGVVKFGPTVNEVPSLTGRPSVYVTKQVKKGDLVSCDNTRIVRPSGGALPRDYKLLVGRRFASGYEIGDPLNWDGVLDE